MILRSLMVCAVLTYASLAIGQAAVSRVTNSTTIALPSGETWVRIHNGLELGQGSGSNTFALPDNFPEFSNPQGMALDSKRQIISITTNGGVGYLYRFDVKNRKWLDVRSLNNLGLKELRYDAQADRYTATVPHSNQPISFSPEGQTPDGRFGAAVAAQWISKENMLSIKEGLPAANLTQGAEVIVVSGYERKERIETGTEIALHLDRPNASVVLVLGGFRRMNWNLSVSPQTRLKGILLIGRGGKVTAQIISATKADVWQLTDLSPPTSLYEANFGHLLRYFKNTFAINKVDEAIVEYSLPDKITINQVSPNNPLLSLDYPPVQTPSRNFQFSVWQEDRVPTRWSLTGPDDPRDEYRDLRCDAQLRTDRNELFSIENSSELRVRLETGEVKRYRLPEGFPAFSHPKALAYDSRRKLVIVASLGGDGVWYRFDLKKEAWLDFYSLNNRDIFALTYDKAEDRFISWEWLAQSKLEFLSPTGSVLSSFGMPSAFRAQGRITQQRSSWGGRDDPPCLFVNEGKGDVALLFSGKDRNNRGAALSIWHYDNQTKQLTLTWKRKTPQ